jgi:hypothetical protein
MLDGVDPTPSDGDGDGDGVSDAAERAIGTNAALKEMGAKGIDVNLEILLDTDRDRVIDAQEATTTTTASRRLSRPASTRR